MTVWEPRDIVEIVGEKRDPSRCGIIPCPVNTENIVLQNIKCHILKIKSNFRLPIFGTFYESNFLLS